MVTLPNSSTNKLGHYAINEDMLSLLLAFQNLTTLAIRIGHAFRIGNKVLEKIAMSWPCLGSLHLGSRGSRLGRAIRNDTCRTGSPGAMLHGTGQPQRCCECKCCRSHFAYTNCPTPSLYS
jgi:hypothetical protein